MRRLICLITVFCAIGSAAIADTITVKPSKDNSVWDDSAGSVSDARGQYMFIGRNAGGNIRRAFIRFDLSAIPSFATVQSVSLTMHASRTAGGSINATLQKVLADWGEGTSAATGMEGGGTSATDGDATWIHRFWPNVLWNTPGGDFSPTISGSRAISGFGNYTWTSTSAMVADVQSWIVNPNNNFGWVIRGNETGTRNAKRLDSRDNTDILARPQLVINYTVPEPTTALLLAAGAAFCLRRR